MGGWGDNEYKYKLYHQSHSTNALLEEAKEAWDNYQKEWKEMGFVHDYVPYPYNRQMIEGYFAEYSEAVGFPAFADGPGDGEFPKCPQNKFGDDPTWLGDDGAFGGVYQAVEGGKYWWSERTSPVDCGGART